MWLGLLWTDKALVCCKALIPFWPYYFSLLSHVKESACIQLSIVSVHFVAVGFDLDTRKSKRLTQFLFPVVIWNSFCICVPLTQLNLFLQRNSRRNSRAYIDFGALRFNKKEWLAVWVHEIWLIAWDYGCVESNPQTRNPSLLVQAVERGLTRISLTLSVCESLGGSSPRPAAQREKIDTEETSLI